MTDRFNLPNVWAEVLPEFGLSVSSVLSSAGLPEGFFLPEKVYATTAELFALWRAIGEGSSDPAIGLKIGDEERVYRFRPARFAALCSSSLRDALQRIARYKQLTCPQEVHVHLTRGEAAVEFFFLETNEPQPDTLVDMGLSWILSVARRGSGGAIIPLRLELTRAVRNRKLLEAHFRCKAKFGSKWNALVFRREDLDRAFVTHNAEVLTAMSCYLETELKERDFDLSLRMKVKQGLQRSLAGRRPTLQSLASLLGMSSRTLQRRLSAEGFTFQEIVLETRRELAAHYLKRDALGLNEVAYLLGYEDANSFFRAFRRWERTSPGEWRHQCLNQENGVKLRREGNREQKTRSRKP